LRDVNYYSEDGVYRVVEDEFEWYIPHWNIEKVDFCKQFLQKYNRYLEEIRSGDTLLKIGAATGEDTIPAARQAGSEGRVCAVEPEPSNFQCLENNIQLKDITNVEAIQEVVSDKAGEQVEFMRHNESHSTHRVLTGRNEYNPDDYPTLELISTTVDDLVEEYNIGTPDMLSVTVNKHEGAVLEGATYTLRNTQYVVCPENDDDDATAVLRDAGFRREDIGNVGSLFVNTRLTE
jgi:FkbM family methyltransferase